MEKNNHSIGFCITSNCKRYTPYNFDMLPAFYFTCIVLSTTLLCISSASHVSLVWICPPQQPPRIQSRKKVIPKIWPVITVVLKRQIAWGNQNITLNTYLQKKLLHPKDFFVHMFVSHIFPHFLEVLPPPSFCSPSRNAAVFRPGNCVSTAHNINGCFWFP